MSTSSNTRKQGSNRFLAGRPCQFLTHLANLPDSPDRPPAVRRLKHLFGDFFEQEIPWTRIHEWVISVEEEDAGELSRDEQLWQFWLLPLRNVVRVIWESTDDRFRRWGIFKVLEKFFSVGDRRLSVGPVHDDVEWHLGSLGPPSLCEEALTLLVRHPALTKLCANSDCQTKYFFAVRRSQKFCSDVCAIPAQRKAKNQWWAAHGPEWRRRRVTNKSRVSKQRGRKGVHNDKG
jgi:hypothetical protein